MGCCGPVDPSITSKLNIPVFEDEDLLIDKSDAVIILRSPGQQFEIAKKTVKKLKHLFIERPLITDIDKVDILLSMQREANVKIQIGAGIRLNKEYMELSRKGIKPIYLETQNFSATGKNSASISVVLNLMLEDLDIVLSLVKSEVQKINAIGVCIVNDTPDIVNARIEFGNGCVATLTAGRISTIDIHASSLFLKDNSIMLDFSGMDHPGHPYSTNRTMVQHQATEQPSVINLKTALDIRNEFISFYEAITKNSIVPVTLYDGYKALKLAYQIIDKIEERGLEN
jgi:predicted dehydrogenase